MKRPRTNAGGRHIAWMRGAFRPRSVIIMKPSTSCNPASKDELLGTTGRKTPARFAIAPFSYRLAEKQVVSGQADIGLVAQSATT